MGSQLLECRPIPRHPVAVEESAADPAIRIRIPVANRDAVGAVADAEHQVVAALCEQHVAGRGCVEIQHALQSLRVVVVDYIRAIARREAIYIGPGPSYEEVVARISKKEVVS